MYLNLKKYRPSCSNKSYIQSYFIFNGPSPLIQHLVVYIVVEELFNHELLFRLFRYFIKTVNKSKLKTSSSESHFCKAVYIPENIDDVKSTLVLAQNHNYLGVILKKKIRYKLKLYICTINCVIIKCCAKQCAFELCLASLNI